MNTSIMYKIENRIRNHIQNNDVRVLYRVTLKYKGVNQIPTGILIETQSLDDNYSICKFCYNVQRKVKFDYSNGSIIEDKRLLEKIKIATIKTFKTKNKKDSSEKTLNYIINRKTNEFHLHDVECPNLSSTESKYIQETTATKNDLLDAKLKPCKKCIG